MSQLKTKKNIYTDNYYRILKNALKFQSFHTTMPFFKITFVITTCIFLQLALQQLAFKLKHGASM
jgi:hypothetical protein